MWSEQGGMVINMFNLAQYLYNYINTTLSNLVQPWIKNKTIITDFNNNYK
jgi:hypothetical protein